MDPKHKCFFERSVFFPIGFRRIEFIPVGHPTSPSRDENRPGESNDNKNTGGYVQLGIRLGRLFALLKWQSSVMGHFPVMRHCPWELFAFLAATNGKHSLLPAWHA